MRISAHFSLWAGIAFTLLALGYAVYILFSVHPDMTAAELSDARGYAAFWSFLGVISAIMALVSWLMLKGTFGSLDE